jgi:hypothetical protein
MEVAHAPSRPILKWLAVFAALGSINWFVPFEGLPIALDQGRKAAVERQTAESLNEPNPKLSPEQVVRIQMSALKHNDKPNPDAGIAIAFKFASPANKAETGPIEKFGLMLKNGAYKPMLNHRSAEVGPATIKGSEADLKVTIVDSEGQQTIYMFVLSRQADGPFRGCWMTDGVIKVSGPGDETSQPIALMTWRF